MLSRQITAFSFFMALSCFSAAQPSLKGLWNGYITTDGYDAKAQYMISIEEHQNGIISGKALLYKPNLFSHAFGLQQFYGTIEKNNIVINDIQILDQRMPTSAFSLCFKLSNLQYENTGNAESLSGKWKSGTLNCIPGEIHLFRYNENNEDNMVPSYVLKAIKAKGTEPTFNSTSLSSPILLNVKKSILDLELRDYLKVDNDTVSVYLNRRLIINKLNIGKRPYRFSIRLNRSLPVNEVILFANNLGAIPPNTSYLTVDDGIAKHKLLIESTLQKSVAIYLNYKP